MSHNPRTLLEMTADIVASYVGSNRVEPADLRELIRAIHVSLSSVGEEREAPEAEPTKALTGAQARKLITPQGITSLINNKPFKSMKRHLTTNGYTPQSYREAFGLPADFPMVHPDYAKARSELAKSIGLGQGGRKAKSPVKVGRKSRSVPAE